MTPFSDIFGIIFIPAMIFLARVCDVSIGTVRILTLSRGYKLTTAVLGFFELMVWLLAINQIFANMDNILYYFAYAGGFATGNYVGMMIEERLAMGSVMIRVVTTKPADEFLGYLVTHRYGYTTIPAYGSSGEVNVLYIVVQRKKVEAILRSLDQFHPRAFYTLEDVRVVKEGVFPLDVKMQKNITRFLQKKK